MAVESKDSSLPELFGLLWPMPNSPEPEWDEEHWRGIAAAARRSRVRPLLHQSNRKHGWAVPQDVAQNWAKAFDRAELRSLRQKAELARIARWLGEAGIECHALKGGAIAWRGWMQGALRPMRDIDLLVPAGQAAEAQQLLISKGFKASGALQTRTSKHLPQLTAPVSGCIVELHTLLFYTPSPEWSRRQQRFQALALSRSRHLSPNEGGWRVFADDDILLHVIVHSVLDSHFSNGPVLLVDVQALIACGEIDWCRFWHTALEIGAVRAAQLVFSLALTVNPELKIDWRDHRPDAIDPDLVLSAANTMLISADVQTQLGFLGRLGRFRWRELMLVLLDGAVRNRVRQNESNVAAAARSQSGLLKRLQAAGSEEGRMLLRQSRPISRWLRSEPQFPLEE